MFLCGAWVNALAWVSSSGVGLSTMSWYRQYRPTTVGQLHLASVRKTLQEMMANGNLAHAFLFAGPKGTGKTSSARIIAAMVNDPANSEVIEQMYFASPVTKKTFKGGLQEPNQKDELVQRIQRGSSYVVSELDAASNRGIDDIRQLKERIFLPPQEGKVSVYILDEAHMLTTEAFNALLKILEEPPAHVVFILATTELHKIPETIVSRCAVIRFQKATPAELSQALEQILQAEKIAFDVAAVQQIAEVADGSFRDAVKLLEMVVSGKNKLTLEMVNDIGQSTQQGKIQQLLQTIMDKKEDQVVQFFSDLRQQGTEPKFFYTQLMNYLHQQLLLAIMEGEGTAQFSSKIAHYFLTQFASVGNDQSGPIPFLLLELKSLEMIFKSKDKNGSGPSITKTPVTSSVKKSEILEASKQKEDVFIENVEEISATNLSSPISVTVELPNSDQFINVKEETSPSVTNFSRTIDTQQIIEKWDELLTRVREKNSSIAALLRSSKPIPGNGEKAQVEVYYQFHREQLQQPKFRSMLEECSQAVFGERVAFEFLLADSARPGVTLSTVSGQVNEEDTLIQLAKEILV